MSHLAYCRNIPKLLAYLLAATCLSCSATPVRNGSDQIVTLLDDAKKDSGVLFFQDFEDSPVGIYRQDSFDKDWQAPDWASGLGEGRIEIVEDGASGFNRSMKVNYPKGMTGPKRGGAGWMLTFEQGYNDLYCAYSLKFPKSFDFVLGGKLPGLVGGKANTGGKRPTGRDGWSARMMWRADGYMVQYVYYPDQRGKWGDSLFWQKDFWSDYSFEPDVWYIVEHRIIMNTPGKSDGVIEGWLNGELALRETGLRFRDTPALKIDKFYFSTFFGGQGYRWAPTKDEYILFDNFIISTRPITH